MRGMGDQCSLCIREMQRCFDPKLANMPTSHFVFSFFVFLCIQNLGNLVRQFAAVNVLLRINTHTRHDAAEFIMKCVSRFVNTLCQRGGGGGREDSLACLLIEQTCQC